MSAVESRNECEKSIGTRLFQLGAGARLVIVGRYAQRAPGIAQLPQNNPEIANGHVRKAFQMAQADLIDMIGRMMRNLAVPEGNNLVHRTVHDQRSRPEGAARHVITAGLRHILDQRGLTVRQFGQNLFAPSRPGRLVTEQGSVFVEQNRAYIAATGTGHANLLQSAALIASRPALVQLH